MKKCKQASTSTSSIYEIILWYCKRSVFFFILCTFLYLYVYFLLQKRSEAYKAKQNLNFPSYPFSHLFRCPTSSLIKKKRTGAKTEQLKILTWPHKNKGNKNLAISWMLHLTVNWFFTLKGKRLNFPALAKIRSYSVTFVRERLQLLRWFFTWTTH